jgi:hypothetical protein
MDGEQQEAMIYIMNDGRPLGQPSAAYYSTIRDGYTDAGFDLAPLRQATTDSTKSI